MDKRGQGLSINAIILIVLGVIVLVVLIAGFTLGWTKLKDLVFPSNNVDTIVSACSLACQQDQTYAFCTQNRTLKAPDLPEGGREKMASCSFFANTPDYKQYGIDDCPGLCPARINCDQYTEGFNTARLKPSCDPQSEKEVPLSIVIVDQNMKCCIAK